MATLEKSTVHQIKSRVAEGEAQVETALTIHWDDDTATREFARRGVVIAAQSVMRGTGDIPATFEVKVSELAKRERGGFAMKPTPQNAQRMMAKLTDVEYAETLAGMGMNKSEVARMIAHRAGTAKVAAAKK